MKSVSRSAVVVLALVVLLTVHACGAGPPGDCAKRPKQGYCTGTAGDLHWYFDEDEFLGWCGDGTSPTFEFLGGGLVIRVDPETGIITINHDDGLTGKAWC